MREELPAARRRTEWLGRREACRPWWKAGSEGGSPLWKSSAGSSAAPAACEAEIRWGAAGRRRKRDLLDAPCRRRRPHRACSSARLKGPSLRRNSGSGSKCRSDHGAVTSTRSYRRPPTPTKLAGIVVLVRGSGTELDASVGIRAKLQYNIIHDRNMSMVYYSCNQNNKYK
ncbi:hypothetical protein GQ55_5G177800 [Panicum hallii var. hallii]|uniref:Uncharacterized protein n=1 Tax=Panicum hallii var. hallii TaxID=1504633 RepID=A0A2T7DHH3_9POAL|nr:hypothetical protein GQ55_5G177800 [Panicum hallii var. hallii]